jgi:hypothetical protein
MADDVTALRAALAGLRAQLAELDELLADGAHDADMLELRAELLCAIADARQACGEECEGADGDAEVREAAAVAAGAAREAAADADGERCGGGSGADAAPEALAPRASVPHAASAGNAGIHPRNRCARRRVWACAHELEVLVPSPRHTCVRSAQLLTRSRRLARSYAAAAPDFAALAARQPVLQPFLVRVHAPLVHTRTR